MRHTRELFLMDNNYDGDAGHVYVSGAPFVPDNDPLYHADFCGENAANDAFLYMMAPELLSALKETLAALETPGDLTDIEMMYVKESAAYLIGLAEERN